MVFGSFQKSLEAENVVAQIRAGLIGEGSSFQTPFGNKKLVYADYTVIVLALRQVEDFITDKVLPFYANSHT